MLVYFLLLNVCLAWRRDHFQLGSGWVGAGGQVKKISTRTAKGLVARRKAQRPPATSQGLQARRRRVGHSRQRRAGVVSQMRQRWGSPAGTAEVPAPGKAFPAVVAAVANPRDKSYPRPRRSNPSCSRGDASLEKQGAGKGNPSLWGLPTGVWGRGRSRFGEDEGGAVLPL